MKQKKIDKANAKNVTESDDKNTTPQTHDQGDNEYHPPEENDPMEEIVDPENENDDGFADSGDSNMNESDGRLEEDGDE